MAILLRWFFDVQKTKKVIIIVAVIKNVSDISLDTKKSMTKITEGESGLYETVERVAVAGGKNNDSVLKIENLTAHFIVDDQDSQSETEISLTK